MDKVRWETDFKVKEPYQVELLKEAMAVFDEFCFCEKDGPGTDCIGCEASFGEHPGGGVDEDTICLSIQGMDRLFIQHDGLSVANFFEHHTEFTIEYKDYYFEVKGSGI